jgi:GNAT superfamily N-acetyltransferase
MSKLPVDVRSATSADVTPLAAVLAWAFYDDPPFVWMLPEPRTRLARNEGVFTTILCAEAMGHGGVEVACAGEQIVGGTIWLPPGHWHPTTAQQLRALPGYVRALGRHCLRGDGLVRAMGGAHPRESHWYLYAIGVDPRRQGQGIAGALLRSRLDRCDRAEQPAYLESSKIANVPLYQHFGFRPTGTPPMPRGAPVLTAMWREPRRDRRAPAGA